MKSPFPLLLIFFAILFKGCLDETSNKNINYSAYLFTYFVGNGPGEEAIHYALSDDGFNFYALNNNKPIIDSKSISTSGGVRDPHVLRGEDGSFYMVVTDLYVPEMGWNNSAMVMMKSKDLISWTSSVVNIPETYPDEFGGVNRVWAPQTIYDPKAKKYMLYWSMKIDEGIDIIYYSYANADFTGLEAEPKQLLYKDGACIDGDIIYKDGKYHLFFKNEDNGAKGIMMAISDQINRDYQVQEGYVDQTNHAVEGSGIFKLIGTDKYILMYDVYMNGRYEFCETSDLKNFTVIDQNITMNFHPRHGSVLPITLEEKEVLLEKWGAFSGSIVGSASPLAKRNNLVIDEETNSIYIPVKESVDITAFDPALKLSSGASIAPYGAQDFSKGTVPYFLSLSGKQGSQKYNVRVAKDHNPVLDGYYADPEIVYSEQLDKYFLYPTSDGFMDWSGTYFETFSSSDLVNWENEGVVLDLKVDVEWADRNAWAPAAIERKMGSSYKYFYYFTAAQKIGVATSDNPAGPFVDSGKPIIDFKPKGVTGGQEIDPDVFHDPVSGKDYLYWGNGYMAVAELNEDMISIDESTIKVLTPDATYREGTEVFFRQGEYYFLWSEGDTRSPDYRVRYAFMESPIGPLTMPEENLILSKDEKTGIYGTGHCSVVQATGTEDWYMVYHRFTRPMGIEMGSSAGFHREVCFDKMEFKIDGEIKVIRPTLSGI